MSKSKLQPIIGTKIGKWEVLQKLQNKKHRENYLCKCDCGTIKEVLGQNLRYNRTHSCGCTGPDSMFWKGYGEIPSTYITRLKYDANRRGLLFTVTIEYLWKLFLKQNKCCALSGVPLSFPNTGRCIAFSKITASLDRIDSGIGYVIGNVQWVHKTVNKLKTDFTDKELIKWCIKISKYQKHKRVLDA